ncbi:MAG: chorismate synthase, partial [Planctomycetota bacterium]|nr:chorismate synthase [Planctomycetota bacterium]
MFERLRFISAGESHGPHLTAILEGIPAGFPIDPKKINEDLARRQKAYGAGGRMKIEKDQVVISSGWMNGLSTGAPIALVVRNRDWKNWATKDIPPMTIPRPGHVDLVAAVKYGYTDLRLGLERASARETAMRVAAGSLCKQILEVFEIQVGAYTRQIGAVKVPLKAATASQLRERFEIAKSNDLACPDNASYQPMHDEVERCIKARDTLGGVFEVFATGLPTGLGTHVHWQRRLDARIAMALMSIQAMKGVEIGSAFENAGKRGTEVHDEIVQDKNGGLSRGSNRAGGLEGGMSTGEPIIARVAMKPIATTLNPLGSVDLITGEDAVTKYERSDFCALPRAVPIGEAMLAMVLTDALLEKLGGDSKGEMEKRWSD